MTPVPTELAFDIRTALADIRLALQTEISHRPSTSPAKPILVRVERSIPRLSLIQFLRNSTAVRKTYWRDRSGSVELAAIGAADTISGEGLSDADAMCERMQVRLDSSESSDSPARYYGGFRFDRWSPDNDRSEEWRAFGGAYFVLPHVEICRHNDTTRLAAQVLIHPDKLSSIEELLQPFESIIDIRRTVSEKVGRGLNREDSPDRKVWDRQVDRVLKAIKAGGLQKLVLARRVTCDIAHPPDLFTLVERSFPPEDSAIVFAMKMDAHHGFFGASPELLYQRTGRGIYSEAVAGTRPLSADRKANDRLADELLASPKERREVDLVRTGIDRGLTPLCTRLQIDEHPHIHFAGNVQHLRYAFSGRLKEKSNDAGILRALSPTPAVCGTPRETAIKLIRELEAFDRGWYAGPIGWVSQDAAEFAVAIRSALVHEQQVHLYSGVGLVEGSDAETEWQELEAKIASVASTLGL